MPLALVDRVHQVLAPDGTLVGDAPDLPADQLLAMYRWML